MQGGVAGISGEGLMTLPTSHRGNVSIPSEPLLWMVTTALMKVGGNGHYALRAAYHSTGVMSVTVTRDQKMAIKGRDKPVSWTRGSWCCARPQFHMCVLAADVKRDRTFCTPGARALTLS